MINPYDIIDDIIKKFGGEKRNELRMALLNLIELRFDILKSEVGEHEGNKIKKDILITDILRLNSSNYDTCIRILSRLNPEKWYHIAIIPDDLWSEFINQVFIKHKIIFDSERGDQYFKVVEL